MKTKAIEFEGSCELGRCGSDNDSPAVAGVEITLDGDLADGDMGEMLCADCAEWLARMLKKRAKQAREKQAAGLEYRAGGDGAMRWRKKKTEAVTP